MVPYRKPGDPHRRRRGACPLPCSGRVGPQQHPENCSRDRCPGRGWIHRSPPSRHISGRNYAISVDHHPDEISLAEPPPWLIALATVPAMGRTSKEEWRGLLRSAMPEGQRNDTLTRISGHLLAHGIDPHVCLDIILSLNATHCNPTLPEHEILNIVASIARRELAREQPVVRSRTVADIHQLFDGMIAHGHPPDNDQVGVPARPAIIRTRPWRAVHCPPSG